MAPLALEWREDQFLHILEKVIGEAEFVQNNPTAGKIPREELVARHVLDELRPYTTENGGPLSVQTYEHIKGRTNLIVTYPGTTDKTIALVGMHMDVVPADPSEWQFNPFKLSRDKDEVRGRGTTDCLGHVALITRLFAQLGETRPTLERSVVGVYIADEEASVDPLVGLEGLVQQGLLAHLKNGPMYWVDCSDTQPCIGTGGMSAWTLTATGRQAGKKQHSAFPHDAINAMELAMDALQAVQNKFYELCPPTDKERKFGFKCCTTMKPTQWAYPSRAPSSTIPHTATISGDIRMSPFYNIGEIREEIRLFANSLDVSKLGGRGPSQYVLPDGTRGAVKLEYAGPGLRGYAADVRGQAFDVIVKAVKEVLGEAKPYSVTGSLPCIADLRDEGFDVCCTGFGLMSYYHANNERAKISDFHNGFKIVIAMINHAEAL
mmetsp:Transcript_16199/g.41308  ORF Transcript_16199/g.41308 Transcript_16199/m.41308 type:complete len:435 (-) Transcript_16199:267-1571(-)